MVLKILERVIGTRIRTLIELHPNQCGFVGGRSTTDAIQSFRILTEKYKAAKKDLFVIFIDLQKAFDSVPRHLIWAALRSHNVPEIYVDLIKDMYSDANTMIRCADNRRAVHEKQLAFTKEASLVLCFLIW